MSPMTAVHLGVRAVNRAKRMWLVYWISTALFAILAVAPVAALVSSSLGHSLYAVRLFANLDLGWLSEFAFETRGWVAVAAAPIAGVLVVAFVLLNTFLAGGAITVLASADGKWSPAGFYQGCGRNFCRLFRLLLFSLVFYALTLAIGAALQKAVQAIWGEGMVERPVVIAGWVRLALVLALLFLVNMIFDYAKIRLVVEDSGKAMRAALRSIALVRRNLRRTSGTYALVALIGLVLLLACRAVSGALPRSGVIWLLLVFFVQQAFIFARIWVKLLFFSSQLEMYRKIAPPPPPAPAEPASEPAVL